MKIYAGQINSCVGDIVGNTQKIITHIERAEKQGADIAIFPELAITGYPPEDLLLEPCFIKKEQQALRQVSAATRAVHVIIGATFTNDKGLHNAAYHIYQGKAEIVSGKANLPNYGVFDERRYFICSDIAKMFEIKAKKIAVLVCEDTWTGAKTEKYLLYKPDLLISINASPFETGKLKKRHEIAANRSKQADVDLVYINTIGGQDGLIFDGGSFTMDGHGNLKSALSQFVEDGEIFEKIAPGINALEANYKAMVLGLKDYVTKNNFKKVLLGLSGGIDSALVATIAIDALGTENVRLVVLPTHFTSQSSFDDANEICKNLEITPELIDIEPAFKTFATMLEKNFEGLPPDLAEENLQSRIRGVTLMAISNKHNELLLTTGNKSELAVGYSTLYGDSCGAFNPIMDLYKTEVYETARWRNSTSSLRGSEADVAISGDRHAALAMTAKRIIPNNVLKKAPTAELRHNQTDQDSLPPYEILDQILKSLIENRESIEQITAQGFDHQLVKKIAKLLQRSEYKRFQSAPGVKLSTVAFGKDWRYPLTNKYDK